MLTVPKADRNHPGCRECEQGCWRSEERIATILVAQVALTPEAINKASEGEKSGRHGHPSTLYLWWARPPEVGAPTAGGLPSSDLHPS